MQVYAAGSEVRHVHDLLADRGGATLRADAVAEARMRTELLVPRFVAALEGHRAPVTCVAGLAAAGRAPPRLASCDRSGILKLWSLQELIEVRVPHPSLSFLSLSILGLQRQTRAATPLLVLPLSHMRKPRVTLQLGHTPTVGPPSGPPSVSQVSPPSGPPFVSQGSCPSVSEASVT